MGSTQRTQVSDNDQFSSWPAEAWRSLTGDSGHREVKIADPWARSQPPRRSPLEPNSSSESGEEDASESSDDNAPDYSPVDDSEAPIRAKSCPGTFWEAAAPQ